MGKNQLISFLQVWGILLVVVGHSFYGRLMQGLETLQVEHWIYLFHMPLFMFISGYLFRYTFQKRQQCVGSMTGREIWNYIFKKAKRLLLPYAVLSSLVFLPKVLLSQYARRPIEASWQDYIEMLLYPMDNVVAIYWFLPTLFVIFCAAVAGAKLLKVLHLRAHPLVVLLLLLPLNIYMPLYSMVPFNIEGAAHHILYFAIGYYCCQYGAEQLVTQRPVPVLCATFALSVVALFAPYSNFLVPLWAINGIVMSIAMGQIYISRQWTFFTPFYGATYTIYLFSWIFQAASQQILIGLTHAPWWVASILAFATGFFLPYGIYLIARRWRGTWLGLICGV